MEGVVIVVIVERARGKAPATGRGRGSVSAVGSPAGRRRGDAGGGARGPVDNKPICYRIG